MGSNLARGHVAYGGGFLRACGNAHARSRLPRLTLLRLHPPRRTRRQRTSGTLTKINGNILTLTTAQGPVTVISSDNTTIQNVTTGTLSDLHAGGYLIAIGSQDANGNITATSIMIRSQGQGAPPTPPDGATPANPSVPTHWRTARRWRHPHQD